MLTSGKKIGSFVHLIMVTCQYEKGDYASGREDASPAAVEVEPPPAGAGGSPDNATSRLHPAFTSAKARVQGGTANSRMRDTDVSRAGERIELSLSTTPSPSRRRMASYAPLDPMDRCVMRMVFPRREPGDCKARDSMGIQADHTIKKRRVGYRLPLFYSWPLSLQLSSADHSLQGELHALWMGTKIGNPVLEIQSFLGGKPCALTSCNRSCRCWCKRRYAVVNHRDRFLTHTPCRGAAHP